MQLHNITSIVALVFFTQAFFWAIIIIEAPNLVGPCRASIYGHCKALCATHIITVALEGLILQCVSLGHRRIHTKLRIPNEVDVICPAHKVHDQINYEAKPAVQKSKENWQHRKVQACSQQDIGSQAFLHLQAQSERPKRVLEGCQISQQ